MKKLYTGPFFPHLEEAFVQSVRKIKEGDSLRPFLLLTPNEMLKKRLILLLVKEWGAIAGYRAYTLLQYAEWVRSKNEGEIVYPIDPCLQECIVAQIAKESLPSRGYFSGVSEMKGFASAMLRTLKDIKKAGMSPQEFQESIAGKNCPRLDEIGLFFSAYEERMKRSALYDEEDILQRARDLSFQTKAEGPLLLYGFWGLSPLERMFLEKAVEGREAYAFIPFQPLPIYGAVSKNIRWLKKNGFEEEIVPPVSSLPESLERIRGRLFSSPDEKLPSQDGPTEKAGPVQLISVFNEFAEREVVAQKILQWAEERPFRDIAILVRSPGLMLRFFKETLLGREIPFYRVATPLSETFEAALFMGLLEIFHSNFSKDSIVRIARCPALCESALPVSRFAPCEWEQLSLQMGMTTDIRKWKKELEKMAALWLEKTSADRDETEKGNTLEGHARSLLQFMLFWEEWGEVLRRQAGYASTMDHLFHLYDKICLPSEHKQSVKKALFSVRLLDRAGISLSLETLSRLVRLLLEGSFSSAGSPDEGVMLGDFASVVGLPFPIVVIPSMVEKDFPVPIKQDPLLPDKDRMSIDAQKNGDGFETMRDKIVQEKLLYHLVVSAATQHLTLSFSRMDIATEQERMPSMFLLETAGAALGKEIHFANLHECLLLENIPADFYFSHPPRQAAWTMGYDLALARMTIDQKGEISEGIRRDYPFFEKAVEHIEARWHKNGFGAHDGAIRAPSLCELLLRHHSPANGKPVDPRQLETYAACPFRFFLQHVLGLLPLKGPPLLASLSTYEKKRLMVDLLSRMSRTRETNGQKESGILACAQDVFSRYASSLDEMFLEIETENVLENIQYYLSAAWEKNALSFSHFKVKYKTGEKAPAIEVEATGKKVHFSGHFDCVHEKKDLDITEGIHYRLGKPYARGKDDRFHGGEQIRLMVDLLALATLFPGRQARRSFYQYLGPNGILSETSFCGDDLERKREALKTICTHIVYGIENGFFFAVPAPQKCRTCPYPEICGPVRYPLFEHKQDDPRIDFFYELKSIP